MTRRTRAIVTIGIAAAASISSLLTVATTASAKESVTGNLAWFEDHWIDLSVDWEDATACNVAVIGTVCFRTEAELDRYLAADAALSTTSTCSSSLRLYDGASYSGSSLSLSTQNVTVNLSTYGFDNRTTSYKVGACDSTFFSAASGGGLVYPGDTSAFAQATTMVFGWDNAVSSVFIS